MLLSTSEFLPLAWPEVGADVVDTDGKTMSRHKAVNWSACTKEFKSVGRWTEIKAVEYMASVPKTYSTVILTSFALVSKFEEILK